MNERALRRLLEDRKFLELKIKTYEENNAITKNSTKAETKGHLEKARHNSDFIKSINPEYNDWKLISCYYAAYHAALALISTKGLMSKNHDATLCLIIKHFYKSGLSKEDIELLNLLDAQDLLFYVESEQKREDAQYSTKIKYDAKDVEKIRIKTLLFISKAEEIIKSK